MSKTVDCPVKGFSGSVVFHDPLTWDILDTFEEARTKSNEYRDSKDYLKMYKTFVPGILVCVEGWKLDSGKNYAVETFPSTPIKRCIEMIWWLVDQITIIINGEETDPNE